MIKLYLYRLGGFLQKAALATKSEKNKLISKTAYELLAEKTSELSACKAVISKTEKGKPYIVNSPHYVSLSHTEEAILFGVSDDEIGVDIELPRELSLHAEERLFSENEIKYVSAGDRGYRTVELWTLREAVCKATGEGFSDWFFNCSFIDSDGSLIKRCNEFNLKVISVDKYVCSIAAKAELEPFDFFVFDL